MNFNSVISKPLIMTEEAAKEFFNQNKTDTYQLVDVRMPEEYEDEHLPGALLVPLPELTEGKGDLDPNKPTIVYCRSGGRSQAAAQWLVGQGYREVYDISFHIRDWISTQATGDVDIDLHLIVPEADYDSVWGLAYAMEEGLQRFYQKLEKAEINPDHNRVYRELAGFEDLHKQRLLDNYTKQTGTEANPAMLTKPFQDALEGGEITRKSPHEILLQTKDVLDIFGICLAIEAQSMDLYTRLSRKAEYQEAKGLLEEMADEEKQHMQYVAEEMRKYLQAA